MGIDANPRRLLVFAPDAARPEVIETERRVDRAVSEMDDRDLQVHYLIGSREVAARERARWSVDASDSLAVLIGRDGGAKLRTELPVDTQAIFALIDTMPMRRREMRHDKSAADE